jgi:hypothetical protein
MLTVAVGGFCAAGEIEAGGHARQWDTVDVGCDLDGDSGFEGWETDDWADFSKMLSTRKRSPRDTFPSPIGAMRRWSELCDCPFAQSKGQAW